MEADERLVRLLEEIRDLQRKGLETSRAARAERAAAIGPSREAAKRRSREMDEDTDRHLAGMDELFVEHGRQVKEEYARAVAAANAEHARALQALKAERRRQRAWSVALALVLVLDLLVSLS